MLGADDIFGSFKIVETQHTVLWYNRRIPLVCIAGLFIYKVKSVDVVIKKRVRHVNCVLLLGHHLPVRRRYSWVVICTLIDWGRTHILRYDWLLWCWFLHLCICGFRRFILRVRTWRRILSCRWPIFIYTTAWSW